MDSFTDTAWLQANLYPWTLKLFMALAIFVIGRWVAMRIASLIERAVTKARSDSMLAGFARSICYWLLLAAVILAALDQLSVNVTSLMAILGAAGLAVGLALKDSLSNFAAGVMIIVFRPFKIGDFIEAAGVSGTVDSISLFSTYLHTGDNRRLIAPNSAIISGTIINVTALDTRRIDLVIGIGYSDNIGQARDIIQNILADDDRVLDAPAPAVSVADLGESSVDLNVRPWVSTTDYWAVRSDILHRIKESLDGAGISIPYPHTEVILHRDQAVGAE